MTSLNLSRSWTSQSNLTSKSFCTCSHTCASQEGQRGSAPLAPDNAGPASDWKRGNCSLPCATAWEPHCIAPQYTRVLLSAMMSADMRYWRRRVMTA